MEKTKICEKCGKELKLKKDFYYSNNIEKYPDGYLNICKDCAVVDINAGSCNFEPYLQILKECDVSYFPEVWNTIEDYFLKHPFIIPKDIIGRYLSKMKLKGLRDWRWADSYFSQNLTDRGERIG